MYVVKCMPEHPCSLFVWMSLESASCWSFINVFCKELVWEPIYMVDSTFFQVCFSARAAILGWFYVSKRKPVLSGWWLWYNREPAGEYVLQKNNLGRNFQHHSPFFLSKSEGYMFSQKHWVGTQYTIQICTLICSCGFLKFYCGQKICKMCKSW